MYKGIAVLLAFVPCLLFATVSAYLAVTISPWWLAGVVCSALLAPNVSIK